MQILGLNCGSGDLDRRFDIRCDCLRPDERLHGNDNGGQVPRDGDRIVIDDLESRVRDDRCTDDDDRRTHDDCCCRNIVGCRAAEFRCTRDLDGNSRFTGASEWSGPRRTDGDRTGRWNPDTCSDMHAHPISSRRCDPRDMFIDDSRTHDAQKGGTLGHGDHTVHRRQGSRSHDVHRGGAQAQCDTSRD